MSKVKSLAGVTGVEVGVLGASQTTAHFGLPIFIATDKPSWLVDWNGCVNKLDDIIYKIQSSTATSEADVKKLNTQYESLSSIVDSMQETTENLVTSVQESNEAVAQMKEAVATMQNTVTQVSATVKEINNQYEAMKAQVTELESHLFSYVPKMRVRSDESIRSYYELLDGTSVIPRDKTVVLTFNVMSHNYAGTAMPLTPLVYKFSSNLLYNDSGFQSDIKFMYSASEETASLYVGAGTDTVGKYFDVKSSYSGDPSATGPVISDYTCTIIG